MAVPELLEHLAPGLVVDLEVDQCPTGSLGLHRSRDRHGLADGRLRAVDARLVVMRAAHAARIAQEMRIDDEGMMSVQGAEVDVVDNFADLGGMA